jgi:uncharacterized membrane protein (DUF2068 family)
MTSKIQRSTSTKLVVAYKALIVLVLASISLLSAWSWRHYEDLVLLAQNYLVDGELATSNWFLKTVMHSQPQGIRQTARLSGAYAIFMGIATVGFWYKQPWANVLMLVMASLPLPREVYEVIERPSNTRLVLLLLNVQVVGVLLKHLLAGQASKPNPAE